MTLPSRQSGVRHPRSHSRSSRRSIGFELLTFAGMTMNSPIASQRGNMPIQRWNVYFKPEFTSDQPLVIPVSRDEIHNFNNGQGRQRWETNQAHAAHQYVLRWDVVGGVEDRDLIQWASRQMLKDGSSDFHSALNVLVCRCAQIGQPFLPHVSIIPFHSCLAYLLTYY